MPIPEWVPDDIRVYLKHTETGRTLREVARAEGKHASTILRHVRRVETKRDDPLIDAALHVLGHRISCHNKINHEGILNMLHTPPSKLIIDETKLEKEAHRILRRLCETSAFLIIANGMEKAAVMRESIPGKPVRTAVLSRDIAQAFALKGLDRKLSQRQGDILPDHGRGESCVKAVAGRRDGIKT